MDEANEILNEGKPGDTPGNISLHHGGWPSDEKLLDYLDGKMLPAEQHQVEQWLSEEGMESDAVEGLMMLDGREVKQAVNKLNTALRKKTGGRKRSRRGMDNANTPLIAVVVVLLLLVLAFIIIKLIR